MVTQGLEMGGGGWSGLASYYSSSVPPAPPPPILQAPVNGDQGACPMHVMSMECEIGRPKSLTRSASSIRIICEGNMREKIK
jgi:hypothetical protein